MMPWRIGARLSAFGPHEGRNATKRGNTAMARPKTLLLSAGLSVLFAAVPAFAATVTVTIVQTNDIDRMEEADGRGGWARLAAVVNEARANGPTLFLHAGDTLSPSLLSGIDKGAHQIAILNAMAPDALVPGNHEFDFGAQNFRDRLAEATFDVVSTNAFEPGGGPLANTVAEKLVELDGVTFGIYGLTTTTTPDVSSPEDVGFTDELEAGLAAEQGLRDEGADIVIALVHTPLSVDLELARQGAADLVVSGHDEHLLTFFDGAHTITESGAQADDIVVTTLTIEISDEDGSVVSWTPSFEIIDSATVEPDPTIGALVQDYLDQLDEALGVAIGTTTTPLDSRRALVRTQETAVGNLIADAMRAAMDADIAITNGGGIRADREYEAGTELTRADVFAELPFGNLVVKLEITGQQLVDALENGFSQIEEVAGRFPQVSGLTVTADLDQPVGMRVQEVLVNGEPVDPNATYTLATNDFMAGGGDGYTAFTEGTTLIGGADATLMASEVIDYIAAMGMIAPTVEGRIVLE